MSMSDLRKNLEQATPGGKWEEGTRNLECRIIPNENGIWYGIQIIGENSIRPIVWTLCFRMEISDDYSDNAITEALKTAKLNAEYFYKNLLLQIEFLKQITENRGA